MLEHVNRLWFAWFNAPAGLRPAAVLPATALAEWVIYLVPCSLTWLWLTGGTRNRQAAIRACAATLLGLLVSQLIGSLWFHPRPFMDGIGHDYLVHVPDSSFPSDHVTILTSVGLALWMSTGPAARRWGTALLVMTPLVGWARIFLGVHYPFDILGAIGVGTFAALAADTMGARLLCAWITTKAEQLYRRMMAIPIARGWLRA